MAARTQTQTVQQRGRRAGKQRAARAYDHVLDPTYTVADGADHSRAARATARPQAQLPHAENMFSELKHHPRTGPAKGKGKAGSDPVPQWAARDFNTLVAQRQAQARRDLAQADVRGRDLVAKHLAQPRTTKATGATAATGFYGTLRTAPPKPKGFSEGRRLKTPKSRTVASQTDYRESETQTDPWTPDFLVRPGSAPEVLTLTTLAYGQGLPAGLAEVEMIERARTKRDWEQKLPTGSANAAQRQRMMEEQEAREWKVREEEIAAIQSERFALMKRLLVEREQRLATRQGQRAEQLFARRQAEKDERVRKMELRELKAVRRLQRDRSNLEGTVKRRSVVRDYASPDSAVFAPNMTKTGTYAADRPGTTAPNVRAAASKLSNLQSLLDLEATLPQSLTQPRVAKPKRAVASGRSSSARTNQRLQATLARLDQTFKQTREGTLPRPVDLRCKRPVVRPAERPPTPQVEGPSAEEEARTAAVIRLQQLMRGRAAQNGMFDRKEERRELIEELRSTHALQRAEQELKDSEKAAFLAERERARSSAHAAATASSVVSDVQAEQIGATVDFLSKELVRLQEQRRIHAFAMLAERERLKREAAESGLRQKEERRRAQNDEVFRQIVDVHQETVESYLEDIILASTATAADEQARAKVRAQAAQINAVAEELHASGVDSTELGAEGIVADLVASFLLPEVERQHQREQVRRAQRRHLHAAHKELHREVTQTEQAPEDDGTEIDV